MLMRSMLSFTMLSCLVAGQNLDKLCPQAKPVPDKLKLPPTMTPGEDFGVEKTLRDYLSTLEYRNLGWCVDVGVRDTGPFVDGQYFGTHKAVRIYYSPEVIQWMKNGRVGSIADGAVIIKEQYRPPAQPWIERYGGKPPASPDDWVIMIKNHAASMDGWFWGELWTNSNPANQMSSTNAFQYPNTGFGLYCVRCHASAESESTFSTLGNLEGYADPKKGPWPLTYRVDDSWRTSGWHDRYCAGADCPLPTQPFVSAPLPPSLSGDHLKNLLLSRLRVNRASDAALDTHGAFRPFPPEPWDRKLASPGPKPDVTSTPYVTSDQCLGCHSGLPGGAFGPVMVVKDAANTINVSEYGEWRWSPMGLAGRDPIFYAQLASEFIYEPTHKDLMTNTCMNCHGAMGLKSFNLDPANKNKQFNADWVFLTDPANPNFQYGGLARDGISCMVCHRMKQPADKSLAFFLKNNVNGVFETEDLGTVNGQYKEVATVPMKASLGLEPKGSEFFKTSRMCATCHTINLPILDKPGCTFPNDRDECHSVEQATYLEWLNSDFQNEYGVGSKAKSCQDCHMSTGYQNSGSGMNVPTIQTRIATVQDSTYPYSDHMANPKDLDVRFREQEYHRHEFLGMNGILLNFFGGFVNGDGNNPILGVRLSDYMSGLGTDLSAALNNIQEQALNKTAKLTIPSMTVVNGRLNAKVTVENLTGHRMPSGVGFRRAFVEFVVYQDGQPIFASGSTNASGEIVGADGKPLVTEYPAKTNAFQKHYYGEKIDSASKVQIYEELVRDAKKTFTTSFVRRDEIVKDNRLLPSGFRVNGPLNAPPVPKHFLDATHAEHVNGDPAYAGLTGGSTATTVEYEVAVPVTIDPKRFEVRAVLQYQSTPPSYFADREATKSEASDRLLYLRNHLDLSGTAFQGWKIAVGSARRVGQ